MRARDAAYSASWLASTPEPRLHSRLLKGLDLALKTRKFSATLYPTFRSKFGSGYVTEMVIGIGRSEDNGTRTTFEASTTADVLSAVECFAKAHSEACQASVHLIEGRKPSGFDAATRSLYYNLERAQTK